MYNGNLRWYKSRASNMTIVFTFVELNAIKYQVQCSGLQISVGNSIFR